MAAPTDSMVPSALRQRLIGALYDSMRGLNPDMALRWMARRLNRSDLTHAALPAIIEVLTDFEVARLIRSFDGRYSAPHAHLNRLAALAFGT